MDATEVRVLDINSAFYGVPAETLMENAGKAVADFASREFKFSNCTVLCGGGNNGGDGLVAARHLSTGFDVKVIMVRDAKTPLARKNFRRVKRAGIPVRRYEKGMETDGELIIDAMLGIGISGELREPYSSISEEVNRSEARVISVDIPTGLGSESAIKPDATVTFHAVKDGMNEKNSGKIFVADIGIPEEAEAAVGPGDMVYYPVPEKNSHKGDNGVVLTIGGGPYAGAPALAAVAALRTGADLSLVFTPEKVRKVVASFSPDIIAIPLDGDVLRTEHVAEIKKVLPRADAIVIGPGLGNDDETKKAVGSIMDECISLNKGMVVDADAIQVFGERKGNGRVVVTPHAGEFGELTGITLPSEPEDRKRIVMEEARKRRCTILLKGNVDIISDGKGVKLNYIHNEGMTVGGTGDVLSGIVGALLSKGAPAYNAARMGALINGTAGNIVFESMGYGMTASDLLMAIPDAIKGYTKSG